MTSTLPLRGLLACSLLALAAGCSSNAVVGIEDDPLPGGLCEGACPSPLYAGAVDAGWSELMDVAATPDGGALFLGRFAGEAMISDVVIQQSPYSGNDELLIKRAADGSIAWTHHIEGNTVSAQVAVRPDGEIVLAGSFQDTADFGTGPRVASGPADFFVQTLLADGTPMDPLVLSADLHVMGLAIAPGGDLLLAATVESPIVLGGIPLAPQGLWDGVIARMSASGSVVFARVTGAAGADSPVDIGALPDGGAVLVGHHAQTFSLDGVTLPALGGDGDTYLLGVDDEGYAVWGDRLDPTPDDAADGRRADTPTLAVGGDGQFVVAFGSLAGDPQAAMPSFALAFQVFDAGGARLGHVEAGTGSDSQVAVALAPDGDVYLAGGFSEALELGGAAVEAEADHDGYLARLSASGDLRWLRTFGAPTSFQTASYVTADTGGRPIVGGQYRGSFAIGDDAMPLADHNPLAFVAAFAP